MKIKIGNYEIGMNWKKKINWYEILFWALIGTLLFWWKAIVIYLERYL